MSLDDDDRGPPPEGFASWEEAEDWGSFWDAFDDLMGDYIDDVLEGDY